jgi:fructosamine-3-kinase
MPEKHIENFLTQFLTHAQGIPVHSLLFQHVGGGSVNNTSRVTVNNSQPFFLKQNSASRFPGFFEKEKEGLAHLSAQNCISLPAVLYSGTCENDQLLLLEWISSGPKTQEFWKKFGAQLAQLHQCSHPQFGFPENNYMGALPQLNHYMNSWTGFLISCRLLPQMELAAHNKLLTAGHAESFQRLFKKLDTIFNIEPASLLHGDLWSGNFMCNERSMPVLIDPAVYYGHRSMDLAMTTLFGGFDKTFYQSYQHYSPFPANHAEQWDICNLYPLLIHLNLFGQSYLGPIAETLKRFS